MNIVLFQSSEIDHPLPLADPRADHILKVLRRQPGETFDAGIINGPRGKATLQRIESEHLILTYSWGNTPPPLDPVTLIIGLPRPQTARKILQEATTLGVGTIHFVTTQRGEASYARSTLWSSGEWQRHLLLGAAQAFCTRLPHITHGQSLETTIAPLPHDSARLALDNYEATATLSECHLISDIPPVLAFGAERGWTAAERTLLRQSGFTLAHLSERVLRLETAVTVALAVIKAQRGLM